MENVTKHQRYMSTDLIYLASASDAIHATAMRKSKSDSSQPWTQEELERNAAILAIGREVEFKEAA